MDKEIISKDYKDKIELLKIEIIKLLKSYEIITNELNQRKS